MTFETDIVKTWEPGQPFRILMLIFLVGGVYFLHIYEEPLGVVPKILAGLGYLTGMVFALGKPFFRSRKVGSLRIDSSEITVITGEDEKVFPLSEIREITLKYSGYGSWKSHSIYGNKNFILMTTGEEELYQFEILIKNEQHKKVLKELFSEELNAVPFYPVKIGAAEF